MTDLEPTPDSEHLLPSLQPSPRQRGQMLLRVGVVIATVAVVTAAAVGTYAYVYGGNNSGAGVSGQFAASLHAATTNSTIAPTSTTKKPRPKAPKSTEPPVVVLPDLGGKILGVGSNGPVVLAYEYRLKQLHFDPGPIDGVYTQETAYAVQAVEKLYGVQRDGQIGPSVRFALSTFHWPKPGVKNGEPDRVEIDLDTQVLTLYRGGQLALITTTSTGSGRGFCGGSDGCQYALTPPGRYTFTYHHPGWDKGKLGELYNPFYFNGGIAVHGYPSVPTTPQSHGCSRIPMHIAQYFPTLVWKGMPVYVLGTQVGPIGPLPKPPPPTTTTTKAPATTAPHTTTTTAPKKKKPGAPKPRTTTTTASRHHP